MRKQHNRISLWTKTATDEAKTLSVGRHLKDIFHTDIELSFGYQVHNEV